MQDRSRTRVRRRRLVKAVRTIVWTTAAALGLATSGTAVAAPAEPARAAGLEIVEGPTAYWPSRSGAIAWVDDDPQATFECSVGDAAFAPCSSPASLAGMNEAAYVFRVRALHEEEEPEEEALAWTVDLTPPAAPAFTGVTTSRTSIVVDWAAASDANPVLGYVAYLNGAARTGTIAARSFAFTNLACGSHAVGVEAVDAAGNVSQRATLQVSTACLARAPRCVVPSLVGRRLRRAKALLAAANCRLGTVSRRYSVRPRGWVLRQSRGPDLELLLGTKVDLVVSRGPRS